MSRFAKKTDLVLETGYENRGKRSADPSSAKLHSGLESDADFKKMASSSSNVATFSVVTFSVFVLIASGLLFYTNAENRSSVPAESLRLVIAVFRHGERTPASTYPNDPHIDNEFFPMGWGALTNEGKRNQYEIGKLLRDRYRNFLSPNYSPKFVSAQTTDVDRTKMSMQLVLAGLYPPSEAQLWNKDLNWQPIPFKYEPLSEDKLLLVNIPCPRYYEALQEVVERKEVKEQIEKNKRINEVLTTKTGMEVKTFNDLLSLQGTLKAEADLKLKLPDWTKEFYPEPLNQLAARAFTLNAYTPELRRIKGGPLLKNVLGHFTDKVNKTQNKKDELYLYGGHDSTIAHLLNALGVWEEHAPEYNALIIIELHKMVHDTHGIKVLFRQSKNKDIRTLTLPGCEALCPLDHVLENTKSVIPTDLTQHCKPKNPNYKPPAAPEI